MTSKKIVIPAILAATVLVAGMFAFMPVQKASTVHTTVLAGVGSAASNINTSVTQTATGATTTVKDLGTGKSGIFYYNIDVTTTTAIGAITVNVKDINGNIRCTDTITPGTLATAGIITQGPAGECIGQKLEVVTAGGTGAAGVVNINGIVQGAQ